MLKYRSVVSRYPLALLAVIIVSTLVAAISGCGGTTTAPATGEPAVQANRTWDTFPSVRELSVAGAATHSGQAIQLGGEYDKDLPNTLNPEDDQPIIALDTRLISGARPGDIAYAMHSFNAADLPKPYVLHVDGHFMPDPQQQNGSAYIGIVNFTRGGWEWHAWPGNDGLAFDSLEPYTSEKGRLVVAIVSQAAQTTVEWLRWGEQAWQFETLDLPQAYNNRIIARRNDAGQVCFLADLADAGQCLVTKSAAGWVVEPVVLESNATPNPIPLSWAAEDFAFDNNGTAYLAGVRYGECNLSHIMLAYRTELGYKEITGPDGYYEVSYGSPGWMPETQRFMSLAFDASNRVHLAYYGGDAHELHYAVLQADQSWDDALIDNLDDYTGESCALALDTSGNPHISYNANHHREQRYASYDGSTWTIRTLASHINTKVYGAGIAILGNGEPVLAYIDSYHLFYGAQATFGSVLQPFDFGFASSQGGCQLITKPTGTPVLIANGPNYDSLRYMEFTGLDWRAQWVLLPGRQEFNIFPNQHGLATDNAGQPHLFYVDTNTGRITHCWLP
jgi:hypothetical protein